MLNGECLILMTKDTFPMNIGGEKVRSERMLLAKVEDGKNMMSADSVRFLVLHCSATRSNHDYSVEQLRRDHTPKACPCLDTHAVFGWIEDL